MNTAPPKFKITLERIPGAVILHLDHDGAEYVYRFTNSFLRSKLSELIRNKKLSINLE